MKEAVENLLSTVAVLQKKFEHHNKKFTLDGKLVGDIGEVLVAEHYGITLYSDNTHKYDGYLTTDKSKEVQIKASFNYYFYFPKNYIPTYFIAINILPDSTFKEVYNGRGELVYNKLLSHLPKERNYPYRLSANKLQELNQSKENWDRI